MTKYKLKTGKVEDAVVGTYKKIENGVVDGYQAIEDAVVGTYKKIDGKRPILRCAIKEGQEG